MQQITRTFRGFAAAVGIALALVSPHTFAESAGQTPGLLTRTPPDGATGVSTQTVVRVAFTQPVVAASISFTLSSAGGPVAASVVYDSAAMSVTLDPTADLAGSTTFSATISAADAAGNVMAPVSWSFTTASPSFQDTIVFSGLTEPTTVEFASDGRVFVAEKSGIVKVFDSLTDTSAAVFADLRASVYNFGDRGLLGMALHPSFPTVPYLYVLYTADADIGGASPKWGTAGTTSDPCPTPPGPNTNGCVASARLSRVRVNANGTSGPEEVLLHDWFQQFPSHSVGGLVFGADGALYASAGESASYDFADYGQAGNPKNPGGDPPAGVGGTQAAATSQGGSLRAQDLVTAGDPVTLDGAIIRIDPETAAALPDNPLITNPDPNAQRIIAHGFRNPFRMAARAGTRELWVADVGWNSADEINRIPDVSDAVVENFGWPCYEGSAYQWTWWGFNNVVCQQLYGTNSAVAPFYSYMNNEKPVSDSCPTGSTSISGLAFYQDGNYPSGYKGALFFADYSRNCIWVVFAGAGGNPEASRRASFLPGARSPVQLTIGPGGDLFYVDLTGSVHRIKYFSGNQPPVARVELSPAAGSAPLTVSFNASSSTDAESPALGYAWDLDDDGAFDDGDTAATSFVYTGAGPHVARVRVTDIGGLTDVAAVTVLVDASYPTAVITAPAPAAAWAVADTIAFSGEANDTEDGMLPESAYTWRVVMHHCPSNCHTHPLQTIEGVRGGAFSAPDHEYPSHLELQLTVVDSTGLRDTRSVLLYPRTTTLNFASSPAGLQLSFGPGLGTTPFTRTVIVGSSNLISAPSPQSGFQFTAWSDGGVQSHNIVAPAGPVTFTASYSPQPASGSLVAAYDFGEGTGSTVNDRTANRLNGALQGATWTASGKYGGALSFNGSSAWVTIADALPLDLTTGMTLEAWVRPTALSASRSVIFKENGTTSLSYALYARGGGTTRPAVTARVGATEVSATGTASLPLNTWTHLAATFDGTSERLYVNGALVRTVALAGSLVQTTGSLRIGGNAVRSEYFTGQIDEVRIYSKALTAAEILTDMNAPISPPAPDVTPPSVSITSPAGSVSGTVDIVASASDNVGVASVQFSVDGANVGPLLTSSPYRYGWNTAASGNGARSLMARARDAAGNETVSSPIVVTVANDLEPPTVAVTSPAAGATVSGVQTVAAAAGDNVGVASVQFQLNGVNLGAVDAVAPFSVAWDTRTILNNTSVGLTAIARDAAGNQTASAPITVTVFNAPPPQDTTPPAVGLTSPAAATVSGVVTISATATDDSALAHIQFYVNDVAVGGSDTAAPYSVSWNTVAVANGPYVVKATATDTSGNTATSATVSVTVANAAPSGGLVAAYGFNETAGATAADSTGNGRTGTVSAATWNAAGRFGGALSFNGSSARVNIADHSSLDLTTGMTLEAWVYPTTLSGWRTVILKESTSGLAYGLYGHDNAPRPAGYASLGGSDRAAMGSAQLPANTWSHLALTYDGTTLRLFVNGSQAGTATVAGSMPATTGALRIGGNAVWGEYFAGRIDEVRIYNRALSAAEITADMTRPVQ